MNSRERQFFANIRDRFIQERVNGYLDTKGRRHPPVSQATALRTWRSHRPRFLHALKDQEVREKFKLDEPISRPTKPAQRP